MNERRALWNTLLTLGPFLFGMGTAAAALLAKNHPLPYLVAPLGLYAAGLSLFLKAKFSLIGRGRLVTFGPSLMSTTNQKYYKVGYLLMGVATLLALLFISIPV